MVFEKSLNDYNLHFHLDDGPCRGQLSETLWNMDLYQDQLEDYNSPLFAHFLAKSTPSTPQNTIGGRFVGEPCLSSGSLAYLEIFKGISDDVTQDLGHGTDESDVDPRNNVYEENQGYEPTLRGPEGHETITTAPTRTPHHSSVRLPKELRVTFTFHAGTTGAFGHFRNTTMSFPDSATFKEITDAAHTIVKQKAKISIKSREFMDDLVLDMSVGPTPETATALQQGKLLGNYLELTPKAGRRLVANTRVYVFEDGTRLERVNQSKKYDPKRHGSGELNPTNAERKSGLTSFSDRVRRAVIVGGVKHRSHHRRPEGHSVGAEILSAGEIILRELAPIESRRKYRLAGAVVGYGEAEYNMEFFAPQLDEQELKDDIAWWVTYAAEEDDFVKVCTSCPAGSMCAC